MYQCWTLLLFVTMHVQSCLAAVATIPNVSSGIHLSEHVQNATKDAMSATKFSTQWPDEPQLGCKELRAKRFISDGFCTSLKALKEVVCAGQCMPIKEINMPWWAEFTKYWAKPKFMEWRCVEAVTKLKKVQLMCENGETRTYKIRVVKSCRCKSYNRGTNESDIKRKNRKEKKEHNRAERKKRRLERRKAKREQRRSGKSRNSRRHRHSGEKGRQRGRSRHGDERSVGADSATDIQDRNIQQLKNNESPTV